MRKPKRTETTPADEGIAAARKDARETKNKLKKGVKVTLTRKAYNAAKRRHKSGSMDIDDFKKTERRYFNETKATIVEENRWQGGYWVRWNGDINQDCYSKTEIKKAS